MADVLSYTMNERITPENEIQKYSMERILLHKGLPMEVIYIIQSFAHEYTDEHRLELTTFAYTRRGRLSRLHGHSIKENLTDCTSLFKKHQPKIKILGQALIRRPGFLTFYTRNTIDYNPIETHLNYLLRHFDPFRYVFPPVSHTMFIMRNILYNAHMDHIRNYRWDINQYFKHIYSRRYVSELRDTIVCCNYYNR